MAGEKKVFIFDSGLGGLNTLLACRRALPFCSFYYYGDNARAPYGPRPHAQIKSFVFEAFENAQKIGADAAVVACNTATALCIEDLRKIYPFPIVGLEPALKPAALAHSNVLLLCTKATAASKRLNALLKKFPLNSFSLFVPEGLVEEIERALPQNETPNFLPAFSKMATRDPAWGAVVLGCTHYEFLSASLRDFFGAPVFSGSEGAAKRLSTFSIFSKNLGGSGTAVHDFPSKTPPVRFLGSGAEINKRVYENMQNL